MRFIVDAQLPPALAHWLRGQGHDAQHVAELELEGASDAAIWEWAISANAAIVSKDEDFAILRNTSATSHPAVIWLRVGNTRNSELMHWFENLLPAMVEALDRGELLIEVG